MAETVMALVLALKQQTEQKLTDSATILQSILRAAANDNGEWYIPLRAEEVGSRCSGSPTQHSLCASCRAVDAAAVQHRCSLAGVMQPSLTGCNGVGTAGATHA
jgi:hypothetical protein